MGIDGMYLINVVDQPFGQAEADGKIFKINRRCHHDSIANAIILYRNGHLDNDLPFDVFALRIARLYYRKAEAL